MIGVLLCFSLFVALRAGIILVADWMQCTTAPAFKNPLESIGHVLISGIT